MGFLGDQALALNIGGPGKGVTADATGLLGPITISLADGKIEEFPYSYAINAGVDIPINDSTGALDLRETQLSAPVKAALLQRTGYCSGKGLICYGSGLTLSDMVNYVNGGNPKGSALGVFPPGIPTKETVLIDTTLGLPIGPLTLLQPIPLDFGLNTNTNLNGSGTLGPFNLGSG